MSYLVIVVYIYIFLHQGNVLSIFILYLYIYLFIKLDGTGTRVYFRTKVHMNVKNTLCIRALTTEVHAYLLHWRVRVPYVVYFNTSTDCAFLIA